MAALPNIVLVHGAWADGSCWSDEIQRLQSEGYKVSAPQLPETSLADDVAKVRRVLSRQSGPTVLAAHSLDEADDVRCIHAESSDHLAPVSRAVPVSVVRRPLLSMQSRIAATKRGFCCLNLSP